MRSRTVFAVSGGVLVTIVVGLALMPFDGAYVVEQADRTSRPVPSALTIDDSDDLELCLSGGGYRAMLFHAGTLARLNDLGLLPELGEVTGISGGAITAAHLGLAWDKLEFDANGVATNFDDIVLEPLTDLSQVTVDWPAVTTSLLTPYTIGTVLTDAYRDHIFGSATLQDLSPTGPTILIFATNLIHRDRWLFSRELVGDLSTGFVADSRVDVAVAVAASSAFPPYLAPVVLDVGKARQSTDLIYSQLLQKRDGATGEPVEPRQAALLLDVQRHNRVLHDQKVFLVDGGVLDNLGGRACDGGERAVISDAAVLAASAADPPSSWVGTALQVTEAVYGRAEDNTRRNTDAIIRAAANAPITFAPDPRVDSATGLSRTAIIQLDPYLTCGRGQHSPSSREFIGDHFGYYPDINSLEALQAQARLPTRLASLSDAESQHLVNWGYLMARGAFPTSETEDGRADELPFPLHGEFLAQLKQCGQPASEEFREAYAGAHSAAQQDNLDEAEKLLDVAASLEPSSAWVTHSRSMIASISGDPERGLELARKSVNICPNVSSFHLWRGRLATAIALEAPPGVTGLRTPNFALGEAYAALERTAELTPCNPEEALWLLGEAAILSGDAERAFDSLLSALFYAPEADESANLYDAVSQTINDENDFANGLLGRADVQAEVWVALGRLAAQRDHNAFARAVLSKGIQIGERTMRRELLSEAQLLLGDSYRLLGDDSSAAVSYALAVATDGENLTARLHQAHLATSTGEYELAKSLYTALLSQPDTFSRLALSDLHNNLGWAQWKTEEGEAAEGNFRRAIEIDGDNIAAKENLASYLYERGGSQQEINQLVEEVGTRPGASCVDRLNLLSTFVDQSRCTEAKTVLDDWVDTCAPLENANLDAVRAAVASCQVE